MQSFHNIFNRMNDIENENSSDCRFDNRFFPRHVNRHFADFDASMRRLPFQFEDLVQERALFQDLFDDNRQMNNTDASESTALDARENNENGNDTNPNESFFSRSFSSSSMYRQGADGKVRKMVRKSYRDSDGQDKEFRMLSTGDKSYIMRRNGEEKEEEFEGEGVKSLDDFRDVWHTKQLADSSNNSRTDEDVLLQDDDEELS